MSNFESLACFSNYFISNVVVRCETEIVTVVEIAGKMSVF